jgi:hypothetical protein
MPEVRFTCPECDRTFKMSSTSVLGKRIKCPNCAAPVSIPEEATEEGVSPAPRRADLSRGRPAPQPEDEDEPSVVRPRRASVRSEEDENEVEDGERPPRKRRQGEDRERRSGRRWWLDPIGIGASVIGLIYLVYVVGALAGPFRARHIDVPRGALADGKQPLEPGDSVKLAPNGWAIMTTKRGGFPFQLPKRDVARTKPTSEPGAEERVVYSYFTETHYYQVEETTYSATLTPKQRFNEFRALASLAEVSVRSIWADGPVIREGHKGRQIKANRRSNNARCRAQRFIVGRHVVTLLWSEGNFGSTPEADVDYFFLSFRPPKGPDGPDTPVTPVEKEKPPVPKTTGPPLVQPALSIQCGVGGEFTALDVTNDGARAIVAGPGDVQKVEVWELPRRQKVWAVDSKPGGYLPVAISSNHQFWAHANGASVRVRDLRTGAPVHDLQPQGRGPASIPYGLAFSPKGDLIAAAVGKDLVGWSTRTGKQEFAWQADPVVVSSLSLFFNRGRKIATGGKTGAINVWDVERRVLDRAIRSDFKDQVLGVTGSHDGGWLAAQEVSGPIKVWELASGGLIRTIPADDLPARVAGMAFVPRTKLLVYPTRHGHLQAIDVTTGEVRFKLQGSAREVWSVRVTEDGTWLYAPGAAGTFRAWDLRPLR